MVIKDLSRHRRGVINGFFLIDLIFFLYEVSRNGFEFCYILMPTFYMGHLKPRLGVFRRTFILLTPKKFAHVS
jgi:hypothetical protein